MGLGLFHTVLSFCFIPFYYHSYHFEFSQSAWPLKTRLSFYVLFIWLMIIKDMYGSLFQVSHQYIYSILVLMI
ncbi:unnamed protein product [Phytomonas sp. EM1]|nr:unnamed protein product [Phytomonas sp. EM1]|eukprot:CCW65174.1 unnamed protein product [Phytomonas sp. isolate EM1]